MPTGPDAEASDLARRLESLHAEEGFATACLAASLYPEAGVSAERIGPGVAVAGGDVIGVSSVTGLDAGRALTFEELAAVAAFVALVGDRPLEVVLAGEPHLELARQLTSLGLRPHATEDVLVRDLDGSRDALPAPPENARIERVEADRLDEWGYILASAFSDGAEPPACDVRYARAIARRPGAIAYWVLVGGVPAACAELWVADDVAWLSADATLPAYRNRGLQRALQEARLHDAVLAGCRLAVTEALPGSASHRNARRSGFEIAYTRTILANGPQPSGIIAGEQSP